MRAFSVLLSSAVFAVAAFVAAEGTDVGGGRPLNGQDGDGVALDGGTNIGGFTGALAGADIGNGAAFAAVEASEKDRGGTPMFAGSDAGGGISKALAENVGNGNTYAGNDGGGGRSVTRLV